MSHEWKPGWIYPVTRPSSCDKVGKAIGVVVREIEDFFRQQSAGTLTQDQAEKIGDLRRGLMNERCNLMATIEAWRSWRIHGRYTDAPFQKMD